MMVRVFPLGILRLYCSHRISNQTEINMNAAAKTTATNEATLGDIFENWVDAKKLDSKGRRIGFVVGFRDNGTDFYAWVQNGRMENKGNADWSEFGPAQRSVKFTSQSAATSWAYQTARERIAKLS